jgi:hypothetical protein
VASGERDGGCAEVLGVGRGRRWVDPVQVGGWDLENKLAGVRRCYDGRGWRWANPCKLGDLENELAGVRRCYGGRGRRWGGSHARCGRSGGLFFLVGEPFRTERAHHLDASGRPHASGRPGLETPYFCQFTAGRIGVARAFPVHASSLGVQFGFELSHDPLLLCLHIICQVSSYPCYTFLYGSRLLIDILFNLELLCLSSL